MAIEPDEYLRQHVRDGNGIVLFRYSTVPGCNCFEVSVPHMPMPLGHVYYRWCGARGAMIEILYIWTSHLVLRCGVATMLLNALKDQKPKVIFSGDGTKDGAAFMKARGFVQDARLGWKLNVKGSK